MRTNAPQLIWSDHARRQAQRRSISTRDIIRVLDRGMVYRAGSGAVAYFYGRRANCDGCCPDHVLGVAVIVGDDQTIITVMHAPRPPRHWRRAR